MDLERRLHRLEKRSGTNSGPRIIYLMPNFEAEEPDKTQYRAKITSGPWAPHLEGAQRPGDR